MVRQTLRIHRVSDARRVLIKCMNRSMASPFRMSTGEVFRFRKDGTREGAKFNIWKIQKHEFVDSTRQQGRSYLRNCWRAVVLVRWRPRRALPCASCQKDVFRAGWETARAPPLIQRRLRAAVPRHMVFRPAEFRKANHVR